MFGVVFLPLVPPFVLLLSLLGAECLPLVPLFVVVVVVLQSIFNALCSANHSILLVLFSTKDIIWGGISFASYPFSSYWGGISASCPLFITACLAGLFS
jgi:hypothetical protein